MIKRSVFAAAVACPLCAPAVAAPTIQTFDVPGAEDTVLLAVNNANTSAGYFLDEAGDHGVIRAPDGSYTIVDPPGSIGTTINEIDQAGDVAGSFASRIGVNKTTAQCFIRSAAGVFTIIGPSNGRASCTDAAINNSGEFSAITSDGKKPEGIIISADGTSEYFLEAKIKDIGGINDAGTVAGDIGSRSRTRIGFVRTSAGTMRKFNVSGASYGTFVTGINQSNLIVGYFSSPHVSGFIREANESFTTFDAVPGQQSEATQPLAINSSGDVVGSYGISTKPRMGFLRTADGKITKINFKGAVATGAAGLNDQDVVVGSYSDTQGVHSFIRTP